MTDTSRRQFLRTAAFGTLTAAAAAASVTNAAAAPAESAQGNAPYDLIILGAGCGGLVCAVRAAQNGLKPLLIEKMPMPSGNTIYAAGFMLGIHTAQQKGINDADTVDAFYEDMIKVSQGHGDKALTRKLAESCDSMMAWLADYVGIQFSKPAKLVWPMLSRAHLVLGEVKPGGGQLAKQLLAKAKELGVEVRFNTKGIALLTDEKTGAVTGARIRGKTGISEVRSKYGVVIATGGFSANQQLVTQYIGSAGAKMPIRGSRIIMGENIRLVDPLFAKVVNVDQYHCGPIHGPTGANPLNIVNNGICVNKKAERFTDEGQTYVQMSRDVAAMTPDNWAYMVCDQNTRDIPILQPDFASYERTKAPIYKGNTIEEAAKAAGLDPEKLEKTVAEYNAAVKADTRAQLTPKNTLVKAPLIEKAPFYIVPFQGGMTATFGGPLIDVNGRVRDTENKPIEGLFAIGNASGGIFYDNYIGGAQLTGAAVFGIAVADYVKSLKG